MTFLCHTSSMCGGIVSFILGTTYGLFIGVTVGIVWWLEYLERDDK